MKQSKTYCVRSKVSEGVNTTSNVASAAILLHIPLLIIDDWRRNRTEGGAFNIIEDTVTILQVDQHHVIFVLPQ